MTPDQILERVALIIDLLNDCEIEMGYLRDTTPHNEEQYEVFKKLNNHFIDEIEKDVKALWAVFETKTH